VPFDFAQGRLYATQFQPAVADFHVLINNEVSNTSTTRASLVEYAPSTILVTGVSKISKDDPISSSYEVFFVSLVVDRETGVIIDSTCNTARDMTKDFIRSLLTRKNLETGIDEIVGEVRSRFFGLVQKSLLVALKDAHNRFLVLKRGGKV
jgi:hypothetical protein